MRNFRWLIAVLAALAVAPVAAAAQQGTIMGQVVDETTRQPLSDVQIFVEGTTRGTLTNAQGRYQLVGIPVGSATLRATRIGYNQTEQQVTVAAGTPAVANFSLTPAAVELGAVIVTATGERQAKREIGNAVATVNVDEDVEMAAVNSLGQVLQGRAAGVSVLQTGGTAGTASRIRIRGSNSVSLSNDPLLIIDGVRADNNSTSSIGVGGQTTGRLDDINPEDIESIEVLKGPAASALYGTAAANGVIVITTKKGRQGDTRYTAYTEQGVVQEVTDFPANYTGMNADGDFCFLAAEAQGRCEVTQLQFFNPLEDPRSTPFEDGHRRKYGLSASGGSDDVTYFLSGDIDDEAGIYKFDLNTVDRKSFRANIAGNLEENLDVTVNTGYVNSNVRLPQNDNNILGILSGALLGLDTEFDPETLGYLAVTPEQISAIDTRQIVERITGSTNINWRPLPWLSFVGTAGLDRVNRFDNETIPPERVDFGSLPEGFRESNRIQVSNYTANFGGTANYPISGENITGTTAAGVQYTEEIFRGTFAEGSGLLAGVGSLEGTTKRFSVGESNNQVRTIGGYVQQQLSLYDRFYLTGALRADDNSAFGEQFGLAYYPSVSASWVVADEPWFPETELLTTFRLRAAYGRSGLRPDPLDAIQFFTPVAVTVGSASVPGFTFGGTGNIGLRPEKSSEIEAGFDAGVLNDRVGLELTYYNKTSDDALISRRLAPSLGVSTSRFENLGEVRNEGLEAAINARLVELPSFSWEAGVSASWTENELVEIGTDPGTGLDIPPIIFGFGGVQRHQEGLPLGAFYNTPYTFEDANNDGLIAPDEITEADSAQFLGSPFPTREVSFRTDATLFNLVRVSGLVDYRGGFKNFNSTEEFRCGAFFTCEALYNRDVSLEQQARAVATAFYDNPTGYIEDASFAKLREVSVTFMVPRDLTSRLGTEGLSLTLAGRNLATWTDYSGFDPETYIYGSTNFFAAEFLTQPPTRFYTARVDVTF